MTFRYSGGFVWVDGIQVPLFGSIPITHKVSDLDMSIINTPNEHNALVKYEETTGVMAQELRTSRDDDVQK